MANTPGTQADTGRNKQGDRSGNRGGNRDGEQGGNQEPLRRSGGERGFAAMDAERQREIASMGGRAAHQQGTAHEFDSAEARAAGRRGGEVVSQNRKHMAEIGALGGRASRGNGHDRAGRNAASRTSGLDALASASASIREESSPELDSELGHGAGNENQEQASNSRH